MRVIHAVSVMDRAGQETFIMNVYRNINRKEIQFDFQCSLKQNGDFDEEIGQMGGKIYYLQENKWKLPILKYFGDIKVQYSFFKEHPGYEVYHIHTYHAFDAWLNIIGAKLAGVKHICLHSHNTKGLHPTLHKIFRVLVNHLKITRFACSYAAGVWMYGEKYMKEGKAEVVKNGIQVSDFTFDTEQRKATRKELGLEEKFVVGHIGRFNYQKNHSYLIQIFNEIKKEKENAVLLLIGVGELKEEIEQEVKRLNLTDSVKFMGIRTDISQLLWAMDVFVFPSLFEGLSVVAIEAQAAGVPILAADTLSVETKISNCFEFCSLDEPSQKWAKRAIELGSQGHQDTKEDIKKAGYDICDTVERLSKIYMGLKEKK